MPPSSRSISADPARSSRAGREPEDEPVDQVSKATAATAGAASERPGSQGSRIRVSAPGGPRQGGLSRLLSSQLHSSIYFVTILGADGEMGEGPAEAPTSVLGLPQIFSPAEATLILRTLGLAEITECALRARAYRRRVPCHVNGRRITFTLNDLHEIAEGQPRRPPPPAEPVAPGLTARPIMRRDTSPAPSSPTHWRARGSRQARTAGEPA